MRRCLFTLLLVLALAGGLLSALTAQANPSVLILMGKYSATEGYGDFTWFNELHDQGFDIDVMFAGQWYEQLDVYGNLRQRLHYDSVKKRGRLPHNPTGFPDSGEPVGCLPIFTLLATRLYCRNQCTWSMDCTSAVVVLVPGSGNFVNGIDI
ncbi:MAG TPA: hypothetical protein VGM23_10000 [Armatimonadota bacterium]